MEGKADKVQPAKNSLPANANLVKPKTEPATPPVPSAPPVLSDSDKVTLTQLLVLSKQVELLKKQLELDQSNYQAAAAEMKAFSANYQEIRSHYKIPDGYELMVVSNKEWAIAPKPKQ